MLLTSKILSNLISPIPMLHPRRKQIGMIVALMIGIALVQVINAGNVAHVENGVSGQFFNASGSSLTTGGVSIGFFQGTAPTNSEWSTFATNVSPSSVYQTLTNSGGTYKFLDLRNVSGVSLSGGFDWTFPLPLGGTVNSIPITTLPQNTQLYALAFNQGSLADSFATSDQWAVAAASSWLAPSSLGTKSLLLSAVTASNDLKIGTDNGVNVNLLAAPVPEPSRSLLAMVGVGFLLFRRRR